MKRVNGKIVQKYVGHFGKPRSNMNLTGEYILPHMERRLDAEIVDSGIRNILKNIGTGCDIFPAIKSS